MEQKAALTCHSLSGNGERGHAAVASGSTPMRAKQVDSGYLNLDLLKHLRTTDRKEREKNSQTHDACCH